MTEPMDDAELAALRHIHKQEGLSLYPPGSTAFDRLFARLDAAEAARDAALARAMPEAQLIQTKEEAAQLPAGTYYISPVEAGEGWFAVEALDTVSSPRWLYLDDGDPRGDHMIAGCFVIRLPDLPTPTAAQEG